jgi:hypothetical protein
MTVVYLRTNSPVRLVDNGLQDDLPSAYCTFSDHTLPVTDIQVGVGRFPRIRVLTASLDHTAKVRLPCLSPDLTSLSLVLLTR